ncbi:MAG: hypothetical protein J2P48_20730 [Alphaproteobacteria bacterium]|nr:hypothetical protein [Alphaproteobacteria bacterium]
MRAYATFEFSTKPTRGHFGLLHPPSSTAPSSAPPPCRQTRRSIDKELRTLRQALARAVKEGWIQSAPYIDTPGMADQLLAGSLEPHVRRTM